MTGVRCLGARPEHARIGVLAFCPGCGVEIPADARFCPACGVPLERRPEPGEERKLASVLFADLVGSTELAGAQDPERTRALLERFYDAMSSEIERAGGTVEKFAGDAVMAAFGAPAALEDHAERALHAALAMQERLADVAGGQLSLRIGVNTGEVVVGGAREGSSFVSGDAVNVGARLEQQAGPGEILVGERTVAGVRGAFEFTEPHKIEAKGKPDGVVCRRLVRALSMLRPRGVSGLRRVFVGRDAELGQLHQLYAQVVGDSKPQLATIIGDAGVGKSRLMRELWGWLADQHTQPLQRTGRCLSYGRGITYWPLAEVLREHFGATEGEPADAIADRLGQRPFLGLTLGLDVAEGLHPLAARERLHDAWVDFAGELVGDRPAVILIEDIHWAEDDLYDLLETLVRQVKGPLLLLATARPELFERRPGWGRPGGVQVLLEALPPTDAGRMLDQLLGSKLPPSVRSVVIDRAEGNPFFVEELLATLIDRGLLRRENGGWSCDELPEGFDVPDTVQAVLAARVDLLPEAEKAALQAASVIGRVFWTGPVYELVEGLSPDFDLLAERDFIRRRPRSTMAEEREYVIKHALTREVAYSSLPKAKRARLHAAFAGWAEHAGEGGDEYASLLAHHFAEAVRPEDRDLAWVGQDDEVERLRKKAVEWSQRAARRAVDRYEINEALALLERALELEPDVSEQAEIWHEIGRANALKYDGLAFSSALEKAIELGGSAPDLYTELVFQTVQRPGMWIRQPDDELVSGWIRRALELTNDRPALRAKALVADAFWHDVEEPARQAHELAESLDDVELRAWALGARGSGRWRAAGDYEGACALHEEWLALLPAIGDPDHTHFALIEAVRTSIGSGRLANARRLSEQLVEVVDGLTIHHRLHGYQMRIEVESARGGWDAIRALASETERTVEANLATPCPGNVASLLAAAVASAYSGEDTDSRRLEAKADAIGMEGYRIRFDPLRMRLAIARGDLTELRDLVDGADSEWLEPYAFVPTAALLDARIVLGEHDWIEEQAPGLVRPGTYVEPFALRALGVARSDEALLDEAIRRFQQIGLDWDAGETHRAQAAARRNP
jgi:class 3 adenylate cyclase/tetratricopeptide (TPR) repeat protein